MQKKWIIKEDDFETVKKFSAELGVTELTAKILLHREITEVEDAKKFLNPEDAPFYNPFEMLGMRDAVDRIIIAIEGGEKICVYGDYDVDGMSASAILTRTLKKLGANVENYIPARSEGYGLNIPALEKISAGGATLLITVDCGISNISEINLLKGFNVDTIITDHHSTDGEIPKAYAIINPQVEGAIKEDTKVDDILSLSYNSGSNVAYKLAMALLKDIDDDKLKDELLIISSCGMIADIVPLIGENRSMASVCLELLNNKKEESSKPIYRLLEKREEKREESGGITHEVRLL